MYNRLQNALEASGIPFCEYAWHHAPQTGPYGVYGLDTGADMVWADGTPVQRAVQGTIDLFVRDADSHAGLAAVEAALISAGISWRLNSVQYEPARMLTHYEWLFELEAL